MRDWPSIVGLFILLPVLLLGIFRASETLSAVAELGETVPRVEERVIGDLPGAEILASARRIDRLANEYSVPTAERSPFARPPLKKKSVRTDSGAIPRVVTVLADGGSIATVLQVGGAISGPILPGGSFLDWLVIDVDWELVLVSREGVIYSLPAEDR